MTCRLWTADSKLSGCGECQYRYAILIRREGNNREGLQLEANCKSVRYLNEFFIHRSIPSILLKIHYFIRRNLLQFTSTMKKYYMKQIIFKYFVRIPPYKCRSMGIKIQLHNDFLVDLIDDYKYNHSRNFLSKIYNTTVCTMYV